MYLRVNLLGPGPRLIKTEFTGPRSRRNTAPDHSVHSWILYPKRIALLLCDGATSRLFRCKRNKFQSSSYFYRMLHVCSVIYDSTSTHLIQYRASYPNCNEAKLLVSTHHDRGELSYLAPLGSENIY